MSRVSYTCSGRWVFTTAKLKYEEKKHENVGQSPKCIAEPTFLILLSKQHVQKC